MKDLKSGTPPIDRLQMMSSQRQEGSKSRAKHAQRLCITDQFGRNGFYTGELNRESNKPHGTGKMEYGDQIYEGQWFQGDWSGCGKLTVSHECSVVNSNITGKDCSHLNNINSTRSSKTSHTLDDLSNHSSFHSSSALSSMSSLPSLSSSIKSFQSFSTFATLPTFCDENYCYIYQGGFLDNRKHGLGVIKYSDGCVYDGSFQQGKMMKGTMTYVDGSVYWGHWAEYPSSSSSQASSSSSSTDTRPIAVARPLQESPCIDCQQSEHVVSAVPHGRGKLTYADGAVYDGQFEYGCLHGHGRMTMPDGQWYLGEWTDGKRNGIGLEASEDGTLVHEGIFCNDRPVQSSSIPFRQSSTDSQLVYRLTLDNDTNDCCSNDNNSNNVDTSNRSCNDDLNLSSHGSASNRVLMGPLAQRRSNRTGRRSRRSHDPILYSNTTTQYPETSAGIARNSYMYI